MQSPMKTFAASVLAPLPAQFSFLRRASGRLIIGAILLLPSVSSRAANLTTTISQGIGESWNDAIWKTNGLGTAVPPVAGNTYECVSNGVAFGNGTSNTRIRNPTVGGLTTFPGNSLTLDTNSEIRFKAATSLILNFSGTAGNAGLILNGGVLNAGDDVVFTITGKVQVASQSYICPGDAGGGAFEPLRGFNFTGQLGGDGTLVIINAGTTVPQQISGAANTFSGKWIVKAGWLLGAGTNSLGTNDIITDPNYVLPLSSSVLNVAGPAQFEVNYDLNSAGRLTLTNGGVMILHQNCAFTSVNIGSVTLSAGTHAYPELAANFPGNFATGGSGSITVQPYGAPPTAAPSIVAQPSSVALNVGGATQLVSTVSGSAPLNYRWQKGTNNIFANLTDSGDVSGSNTNTLIFGSLGLSDAADYRLIVTNSVGSVTSQVATVTVLVPDATMPVVSLLNPAAGATVSNLTQIQVIFSKNVAGVDAADLMVAGNPATSISGAGSNYVFTFTEPSSGTILIDWDGDSGITDLSGNAFDNSGNWIYTLIDNIPPVIVSTTPAAGAIVGSLTQAQVIFDEAVTGVNASAFLVNGVPATSVSGSGIGPYVFQFVQPAQGSVQFSWSPGQTIQDAASNLFGGAGWTVTLNPASAAAALTNIVINEILTGNTSTNGLLDEDGLLDSWIEIYNRGTVPVNLAGWSLTDDPGDPAMWTFPPTNLAAGQYLVVFASGDDRRVPGMPLHTNFKLGNAANYLSLFNADFPPQAAFEYTPAYPEQRNNISYGLDNNGAHGYFAIPTPGGPNGFSSITGVVAQLSVSLPSGFFSAPTNVWMTTATPGAAILYTTDGSVPTISGGVTNGTVYAGPVNITNITAFRAAAFLTNMLPTLTVTRTYLYPEYVIRQPNNPTGYPTGNVWTPTPSVVQNGSRAYYQMNPAIVNDPQYTNMIRAGLISIPTMSITLPIRDLFDPTAGIYTHPMNHSNTGGDDAWERDCSMELIFPDGSPAAQADCGLQIQGGTQRDPAKNAKHSLRVSFKSIYGPGKFKFPMFADSPVTSFNTFVLDGGINLWWHYVGTSAPEDQRNRTQCVLDQFTSDLMLAMGNASFHGQFYNIYLNGLYWGLHYVHERPDADYAASYFGGDDTDYDVIKNTTAGTDLLAGDLTAWNIVLALSSAGITNNAQYEQLRQYVDVDNLIDYMIVNHWANNTDWPQHNWYVIRSRAGGVGFQFIIWDAEHVFGSANGNVTTVDATGSPAQIYNALRSNAEFRLRFADHLQKHLSIGGVLFTDPAHPVPDPAHPERNVPAALYLKRINEINTAIVDESARWGGYWGWVSGTGTNYTRNDQWLRELNNLLGYTNTPGNTANFFPQRSAILLSQYKAIGLFPSVSAPGFNQLGGNARAGFALTMNNPNAGGTIFYTTDGTDPRAYGSGAVTFGARVYTNGTPLVLNGTVNIKARVLSNGTWSALTEGDFTVGLLGVPLRITELMYNPIGGANYEFLEVQNIGATPLDVSGFSFSAGITFVFPNGTILQPGAVLVLANNGNPTAWAARYPGVSVFGYYGGNLNNGGERVAIVDAGGNLVTEVTYNNSGGWPTAADGGGYSLELIDPYSDLNSPANWRASSAPNGTPGLPPVTPPPGDIVINELMADNQTALSNGVGSYPDWLELFNRGTNAVDISNWSLANSGNARKFVFPASTIIASNGFLFVWCDTDTSAPGLHAGFALAKSGDQILIYDAATNRVDAISFGQQVTDLSLGRVNGLWQLTLPTPNAANIAAATDSFTNVAINEWLTTGTTNWIELFNRSSNAPVALQGVYLASSNSPFRIGALSFLPPRGFLQLFTDTLPGPNHVDLVLSAASNTIALYDDTAIQTESINYGAQTNGVSQGRFPDGAANLYYMPIITPGAANVIPNHPPELNIISNRFVHPGQTLQFIAVATDADSWYQTLTFSLTDAPAGAAINPLTGAFSWTVTNVSAPGTNSMTVLVTDNGTPLMSDAKMFQVIVGLPLQFGPITSDANGNVNFTFNSLPGESYQLTFKNDLNDPQWTPIGPPTAGTGGPLVFSNSLSAQPQRFYRIAVTAQ